MTMLAAGEMVTGPEPEIVEENARLRIGLMGVTMIIVGVFAVLTILHYTLQKILGIPIPYPEITLRSCIQSNSSANEKTLS